MAQDDFLQFQERVKQAESRGRRYDKNGNLLTSPKGAQGEMQVMPATQRSPGFGITPAKDRSPDEIARVGTDYLATMKKRYGDETLAAIAYNMGPGATDKWLASGADFSKLPAETQGYVQKVMGKTPTSPSTASTPASQPTPSEQIVEPALRSGMTASAEDLGSGYKAALALSFLGADDADKPESDADLQARLDKDEEDTAAAELAAYKPKNAFADLKLSATSHLQPRNFADGGDVMASNMPLNTNPMAGTPEMMLWHGGVVHRADGSPMGGENTDHLTPQEIERMAEAQRPAFVTPGSGRGRQQGPISQALNSGTAYPAMARGVAELPYDIAGAPVDLATMAMRPFGYSTEKPVMGSDWIKEKMTASGVRPGEETDPTLKGFRTFGELGANLVNPAAVARKAGPIVEQGAKALGKETARQMLRGMEGEGPLAAITPKPLYAVKPRGGTFATSGDINAQPISKMDEMLESYREALKSKLPEDQHSTVDAFVDKKVRKYFTNEFGTANDPLRQAMRSGEMPLYGRDVEEFPEYLLAAARDPNAPGHLQAKRHLEKFYDERTGLELKALNLSSSSDADARRRFSQGLEDFRQKERERMTAEGLPAEFQNPERPDAVTLEDIQRYPNITRTVSGMIKAGEEGRLPSGQVWALQNQQPFYDISSPRMGFLDPRSVAETIQSLDPNKLKNMSFDQAMIEGTKNMRVFREYDTAVDRASKGLSVPKEVLGMFTKPVLKSGDAEWVRLTEPAATKLEGKLLHHSVGGYADNPHYNLGGPEAFRSGKAQIFSLRQEKTGLPEVTIEAEKTNDGLKITQIKGDYNSFPSHRAEDVFKFMDKHPNLVHINSEYYPRSNNGAELEQKIGVDWAKSYDHWKSGLPGEWIATRQDPRRIDYVYGLPEEKAKGGMIERKTTDNRRYL